MNFKKRILLLILAALLILSGVTLAVLAANEGTGADTGGDLDVYKCNLSFRSNVCIKYAIATEDTSVKMLIWRAPQTEYTYSPQTTVLAPVATDAIDGKSCLIFDYTELAAADMTEVVYARAYKDNGDGTYEYGAVKKYSILQYAYNKLGYTGTASTDEELKQMLRDMLVYGASAQKYLDRNTDRLATADFYQVVVEGGLLADGCTEGLYLLGESVTLIAPATNAEGQTFSGWTNAAGERIGSTATYTLTVPAKHDTYTAVYGDYAAQYSEGLAFTSNGDGTCYVSGIGSCTDLDIVIPPVSPDGDRVTSIGYGAFYDCSSLTSITIPEGVKTIGNEVFYNCSSLTSVTIPESTTSIGLNVFYNCSGLTSLEIPTGVTSIGENSFKYTQLVQVENGISYVGQWVVGAEASITVADLRSDTIGIANSSFSGLRKLTSIMIPESVVSIGDNVFQFCTNLTSIEFGGNSRLTNIGEEAFENCSKLNNITIPESVASIGYNAFYGCTQLIQIENNISYVGKWVVDVDTAITAAYLRTDTIGIANSTFVSFHNLVGITIPASVKHIGDQAFYYCTKLTSIEFEENSLLESIGKEAFLDCSSLKSITIPAKVIRIGDFAFNRCKSLTNITIPASVTSIGDYSFYRCDNLSAVYYFGTVLEWSTINVGNFNSSLTASMCYYYSEIQPVDTQNNYWHYVNNMPEIWETWRAGEATPNEYFSFILQDNDTYSIMARDVNNMPSTVILPMYYQGKAVTKISDYAFNQCYSLVSITIPESVTSIGGDAFYGCHLTSITIPSRVTSIGAYAFGACMDLTSITFSEGSLLTSIGKAAFSNCNKLESITIPASVVNIGEQAFIYCYTMASITVETGNITYHSAGNCLIETASKTLLAGCSTSVIPTDGSVTQISIGAFAGCCELTSIEIPVSVTRIGNGAFVYCTGLTSVAIAKESQLRSMGSEVFRYCSSLTSITIPASVTSIGDSAFEDCSSLTSITIPAGVTSIGNYAFDGCSSLTSITIPEGVTSIGSYAFRDCSSLAGITIPTSVMSIGYNAFNGCSNLTSIIFKNVYGWFYTHEHNATSGTAMDVSNPATNATNLVSTYRNYYWKRS